MEDYEGIERRDSGVSGLTGLQILCLIIALASAWLVFKVGR